MDKVNVFSCTSSSSYLLPKLNSPIERAIYSNNGRVMLLWTKEDGLYLFNSGEEPPSCTRLGWVNTYSQVLLSSCELDYHGIKLFVILFVNQLEGHSTVSVVSQSSGQLIQCISIPVSLTAVCAVTETSFPGLFSMATLQYFTGAVCLGCEGGGVVVLDLGLGSLQEQPRSSMCAPRGCRQVHISSSSIVTQMRAAANDNQQLGLDINSQYVRGNVFHYADPADKLLLTCDNASVSSLLYVHQICSVLIGYSFGGFQIFSFYDNNILFTFPLSLKHPYPAITHFAFQEPENDPKPYVYIWTARNGLPAQGRLGSSPTLTMFQLGFLQRHEEQGTYYYQDMEACIQRFEYLLWPNPTTSAVMLSCSTIERKICASDLEGSFSKSYSKELVVDRTLAVFMCRQIDEDNMGGANGCGLMMVFDLNQWYHSQMPVFAKWSVKSSSQRKSCSFVSLYEISTDDNQLLDSKVTSVAPFHSISPPPESHFWPESLDIGLKTLTNSNLNFYQYKGVQLKTLNEMRSFGTDVLLDVKRFVSMCIDSNLLEVPTDDYCCDILSVCLQYKLRDVLVSIAKSVQNPGFSLSAKSFLDWIKEKLDELVTEKFKILEHLMTTSTGTVDRHLMTSVWDTHLQLDLLRDVLVELYQTQAIPEEDLSSVYTPSCVYSEIYQAVHWCMENGLLPHAYDSDHTPTCDTTFVFPVVALRDRYNALTKAKPTLAINVLIEVVTEDSDESQLDYPPTRLDFLLQTKRYPSSISRDCLDLYLLHDLSTDAQPFVQSYCDYFGISGESKALAKAIWSVDHDCINVHAAKLLGSYYPSLFELGVNSLIEEGLYHDAIRCMSVSDVSCPTLLLRSLVSAGLVQKAFVLLGEYEGSRDYEILMEQFVNYCLLSPYSNELKKLQLNQEQLVTLCDILKANGKDSAIELAVSLLLVHQCNIEAINLAREMSVGSSGRLVQCIAASGAALLPPVKQSMISSDELLRKMESTMGTVGDAPTTLSTVMPKMNEHQFRSQVDVLKAVSQKVTEARQAMAADPVTPLRKHSKLNNSFIASSPALNTFTSSPMLNMTNRSKLLRETPLVRSIKKTSKFVPKSSATANVSQSSPFTPRKLNTKTEQFKSYMEGFRMRMDKLTVATPTAMMNDTIKTPYQVEHSSSVTIATSILKSNTSRTTVQSTTDVSTSSSRRIRFNLDDSLDADLPRKPLSATTMPLPESDDEDGDDFYSPVKQSSSTDTNRPDMDEPAANIVVSNKTSDSYIASAEDEEHTVKTRPVSQLSPLKEVYKSPSKILEGLTRSKMPSSSPGIRVTIGQQSATPSKGRFSKDPTVVLSPFSIHSVSTGESSSTTIGSSSRKKHRDSSSKTHGNQRKKYSGVMVNVKQPQEDSNYMFSPPKTVATVTPAKGTPSTTVESEFVFSPPLLRSANREKKLAEFKRTGIELDLNSSNAPIDTMSSSLYRGSTTTTASHQKKAVRQMKTAQGTPRRSERLLRSSKK